MLLFPPYKKVSFIRQSGFRKTEEKRGAKRALAGDQDLRAKYFTVVTPWVASYARTMEPCTYVHSHKKRPLLEIRRSLILKPNHFFAAPPLPLTQVKAISGEMQKVSFSSSSSSYLDPRETPAGNRDRKKEGRRYLAREVKTFLFRRKDARSPTPPQPQSTT